MKLSNATQITKEEADALLNEGVASLWDCDSSAYGFFETREGARVDIVLVITNDGYFLRSRDDLVKSKDEVFVCFLEDGKPPEFEDVFGAREL